MKVHQRNAAFQPLDSIIFHTRDPQLRKYAGETGNGGGVYVRGIEPGSAVEKAGLQEGDILTAVGNFDLDQNGNYDDPLYKKLEFTNLLTTRAYAGDKVPLKIHRQGKPMQLDVTMEHRAPDEYIISPYSRMRRRDITFLVD